MLTRQLLPKLPAARTAILVRTLSTAPKPPKDPRSPPTESSEILAKKLYKRSGDGFFATWFATGLKFGLASVIINYPDLIIPISGVYAALTYDTHDTHEPRQLIAFISMVCKDLEIQKICQNVCLDEYIKFIAIQKILHARSLLKEDATILDTYQAIIELNQANAKDETPTPMA